MTAILSAMRADHREVVRDQQQARAGSRPRARAAAPGSAPAVLTSSAVVGSSAITSLGFERARHGDDHALALAARQLVRIADRRELRGRQPDAVEHLSARASASRRLSAGMPAEAFGDLLADRLERVQRRHRLLEHHADVVAAQARTSRSRSRARMSVPSKSDRARRRARRAGSSRMTRERRHRLAGAGFADQPHHLAGSPRRGRRPSGSARRRSPGRSPSMSSRLTQRSPASSGIERRRAGRRRAG